MLRSHLGEVEHCLKIAMQDIIRFPSGVLQSQHVNELTRCSAEASFFSGHLTSFFVEETSRDTAAIGLTHPT